MKHEVEIPDEILEQVEDVKSIGKGATKVQRAKLAMDLTKELNNKRYFAGDIDSKPDEERRYIKALESICHGIGFNPEIFLNE